MGGGGDGKVAKGKAGKKGGKKGKGKKGKGKKGGKAGKGKAKKGKAAAPCDCPPLAKPCICQGTVSTACNAITPTSDRCIATETEKEGSCTNICLKHFKQLLGQEMDNRQNTVSCSLSKVMEEKDYYMKQYHKLLEQLRKIPAESPPCSVCYRNEQIVQTLQHENKKLSEENCSLLSKLESSKMTETDMGGAKCNRVGETAQFTYKLKRVKPYSTYCLD